MVSKLRIIWKQQQLALDPSSRQALELLQRNARGNGPREILQQIESAEGVDSVTRMHAQRAGFALRLDEEAATRPRHAGGSAAASIWLSHAKADSKKVRVQIIRHARTHSVCNSQSCMFLRLPRWQWC